MHTKKDKLLGVKSQETEDESVVRDDREEDCDTDEVGYHQQGAEQEEVMVGEDEESGDEEGDEVEVEEVQEKKKNELKNTYKYLLDALVGSDARRIEEVKMFVGEMRRITLLREELWIGALNQIRK